MNIAIGIPARMASSRFPGKPLVELAGKPMLAHVIERAKAAELGSVFVATDDEEIARVAEKYGANAVMTPADCSSGSERLAVAARDMPADLIINVQGDEPLIDPQAIRAVITPFAEDPFLPMATLAHTATLWDLDNPHVVKVVCDARGRALYFSRAPIPYQRDTTAHPCALRHVGLYAYRREFLLIYPSLEPCEAEKAEQLEQLRVLHHGYDIAVTVGDFESQGVDTPEDLQKVLSLLRQTPDTGGS
ncbi:MAG: 3-deoxy-manno-octulosonate cytidylyltransferase [Zetaproteobacteria bacterium]|nr:MAG: 3-deoxy-manno-octulosonate cytidylyltransferase [Zetaproteobacteria bacterium]